MFDWHFTLRGPRDTEFEGGVYHGRILLPADYPFKPPNIMLLTPNGRFEVRKKICLSISAYHPEEWQPAWGGTLVFTFRLGSCGTRVSEVVATDCCCYSRARNSAADTRGAHQLHADEGRRRDWRARLLAR